MTTTTIVDTRSEKGIALVVVLLLMAVLSGLATGFAMNGRIETALAHHTEREETGLFHTLHDVAVGPEYLGLFEHDHGHLVDLIATARGDRSNVDDLVKSLEAQMLREENDMFPAAEQLLGPADWSAIGAAVAHLR